MNTHLPLRYGRLAATVLLGAAIMLFWWLAFPHALSYQEQYQLFLWTPDYLLDALSIPGGFSAWLGEMVVQFYAIPWLGALLLGILFVALQCAVAAAMPHGQSRKWFLMSLVPPVMVLGLMGDESTLLAYPVGLTLTLALYAAMKGRPKQEATAPPSMLRLFAELPMLAVAYWAVGPLIWLYVVLGVQEKGWRCLALAAMLALVQWLAYTFLLPEWTLYDMATGRVYYRIPLMFPTLMWVIPLVVAGIVLLSRMRHALWMVPVETGIVAAAAFLAVGQGYDKDKYELIRQDYLVRNERWDDIISRAKEYQVTTAFSSVCVNLALSQKRQLADHMFDYFQSGPDALLMPMRRDLTSMLPTAEVFWRLGMVNSAQRYMFDTQESILNGKKSGRCTKRIVECMMVNGHYKPARKHIDMLKATLFYRQWAKDAEECLGDEAKIDAHPVWGKMRRLRYKEDFLYNYPEMDKMLGLLFVNNPENKMALDYMIGQQLLNGDIEGFSQSMPLAQQYGGYYQMPLVYQDVANCIRTNGQPGRSQYMNYMNRMRRENHENEK